MTDSIYWLCLNPKDLSMPLPRPGRPAADQVFDQRPRGVGGQHWPKGLGIWSLQTASSPEQVLVTPTKPPAGRGAPNRTALRESQPPRRYLQLGLED